MELSQDFQDDGGDVVVGSGSVGKSLEAGEEVFEGLRSGLGLTFGPEFGEAIGAELDAGGIERFVEAVGGEQNGVSGGKLNDVLVIAGGGEKAGWESAFADGLTEGPGGVQGEGESSVGESERAGDGIEDGVKRGAEAAGQRTLQETLVQNRQERAGVDAGLVNAAQRAHDEGAVHGGGESLADDVAEVESDESVGQHEEIKEVSADVEEGREAECDFNAVVAQRRGGDERRLDKTRFADVIVADAAAR